MLDLIAVAASVALPWLAGSCCVLALQRGTERDFGLVAGYGYLLGALALSLAMRASGAAGARWSVPLLAAELIIVAAVALACARPRSLPSLRERAHAAWVRAGGLAGTQRLVFFGALALRVVRLLSVGLELAWRPLLPWDAWAHWATKARVWFEYRQMAAFVDPAQWLASGTAMQFVDAHSDYPATVPLLQAWTALCLGHWDESLVNAPWLAILIALGVAFYAQLRRIGVGVATAMLFSYLLLSIPFIDLHVAVAGYADIFMAAAYGMTAMTLWQWVRTRRPEDATLALLGALACVVIKKEGVIWALTLLPPVLVALNRRIGLGVVAVLGVAMLLYLVYGPGEIHLLGYALRTRFSNVSRPMFEHYFEMDNWHLLFYLTLVMIALRWRMLVSVAMAPMTVTMLGAFAFVFVVFFFSNAAMGVAEETLVNRLPLHLAPALAFYLALLWRHAPYPAGSVPAASARPPAP